MANATTLITEILGTDADVERVSKTLMADKVGSESYSIETYQSHLEAVAEKGDAYLSFLDDLRVKPGMTAMFGFIMSQGPDGVYGLIETMSGQGLIDKKRVASAAKLPAKARAERAWFRQIWDDLATDAWGFLADQFETRREEFEKRFPEVSGVEDFKDLLVQCGKSTLNAGVEHILVEPTQTNTSLALGFRIDAHSPKRNGGWNPKANDGEGALTQDYYDRIAKKEAAAAEDTSDEDSASDMESEEIEPSPTNAGETQPSAK